MRRLLLLLLASSAWLDASWPSAAQVTNPIVNMPFIAGELSVVASRCGLRDKIWVTRLLGKTISAIQQLDWSVVTPQTGETEESLMIHIQEGQEDGLRTLANDHAGTCAKLTPERLAKIDKIVAGTTPVF
jgi:hypothetical protein